MSYLVALDRRPSPAYHYNSDILFSIVLDLENSSHRFLTSPIPTSITHGVMDFTTTQVKSDTTSTGFEVSPESTTMTASGTVSSVQSESNNVNTSAYKVCDSVISRHMMCSGVNVYGQRNTSLVIKITQTLNHCMAACYCKHPLFT